jgi:hypothetical protein
MHHALARCYAPSRRPARGAIWPHDGHAVAPALTLCPLYVARGRRIGCEGATDRLPHGPSSAQRPLNSEGRDDPLTDREPEQLPGTLAKPTSPHRQGRATNGGKQPDDANAHLLGGHRRGQGPLGRGAPAGRTIRGGRQRRAGHPLGGAPSLRKENVALWRYSKPPGGSSSPPPRPSLWAGCRWRSSTPGRSGISPRPRASSPRPTGSTPRCSPTSPRR